MLSQCEKYLNTITINDTAQDNVEVMVELFPAGCWAGWFSNQNEQRAFIKKKDNVGMLIAEKKR